MLTVLLSLGLGLSGSAGAPSKSTILLADQLDRCTFAGLGRVTEIVEVDIEGSPPGFWPGSNARLPFARVEVERVLVGDPGIREVFHEAWASWTCDSTRATVGERALLVLGPPGIERASEEDQARVAAALGGVPVYRNIGSGDGILGVRERGGEAFVSSRCFPRHVRSGESSYEIRLSAALAYVEECLRFAPAKLAVHVRGGILREGRRPDLGRVDVRILPDGEVRVAQVYLSEEVLRFSRLPDRGWRALRADLRSLVGSGERFAGEERPSWNGHRLVTLRSAGGTLTLRESLETVRPEPGTPEAFATTDALNAFSRVLAALDLEPLPEHAARDRAWFAR